MADKKMGTVLVVGSTGNIGVAAVLAALRSGLKVLAIVRNQASASKLLEQVGTGVQTNITCVEADVTSDSGVRSVVDQVRAGKLPLFQHVFSAGRFLRRLGSTFLDIFADTEILTASAGGGYPETSLLDLDTAELRSFMNVNFESNFCTQTGVIQPALEWVLQRLTDLQLLTARQCHVCSNKRIRVRTVHGRCVQDHRAILGLVQRRPSRKAHYSPWPMPLVSTILPPMFGSMRFTWGLGWKLMQLLLARGT